MFLLTNVYAGNTGDQLPLVGRTRDVNNCLVSAGYTWCQSSQNCLRQWEILLVKIILWIVEIDVKNKEMDIILLVRKL